MGRRQGAGHQGDLNALASGRGRAHLRVMDNDLPADPVMLPAIAAPDRSAELRALAERLSRANGPVMGLILRLGGTLEGRLDALPDGVKRQIEAATERALSVAFGLAAQGDKGPDLGRNGPMLSLIHISEPTRH